MSDARSIIRRAVIGAGLLGTFVLTASVFAPDKTQAKQFGLIRDPIDGVEEPAGQSMSTDPHEGLRSLGAFESPQHIIKAFSTDAGARYTVYDARTRKEIATLMSADELARFHPEVSLRGVRFDAPETTTFPPLMLAEPSQHINE